MGADFVIRAATEADVPALAQIHVDEWRWAYRGLVPEGLIDSRPSSVGRRCGVWSPDGTEKSEDWNGFPLREARYLIEFPG
jgi:hypothetical protein